MQAQLTRLSLAEPDYCLPNFFGTLAAMTELDLPRFGRLVRTRREELGIQQEEVDDHGGPSSTTMSRVERGIAPPSAKTLRKLDAGLQWQQGSAVRALEGGDPTPVLPRVLEFAQTRRVDALSNGRVGRIRFRRVREVID